MTLARAIITAAYRESQLIAIVATPSTLEQAEALALLNTIIISTVGSVVGQELSELMIGGDYDQTETVINGTPPDIRLVLNLNGGQTVLLWPAPYDGARLAIADAKGNLSTSNLTLDGNGRMIEGATTLTLSTDSLARQWFYRADTGNWVRLTDLAASDELPFPGEFDDYFITTLAMRLNPRNGVSTAKETVARLTEQKALMRARYRKPRPQNDPGSLGLMGQRPGWTGSFNFGRPW